MNYTVTWEEAAETQLATLWLQATDKSAVAGYIDQMDRVLGRDPKGAGESRNETTRIAFFRPLVVRFHIDETLKIVTVTAVRWVGH